MKLRFLSILIFATSTVLVHAEESWMGIYLQGSKIGHAFTKESTERLDGQMRRKVYSENILGGDMLGSAFNLSMKSTTWMTPEGRPYRLLYSQESGGRTQVVRANFTPTKISAELTSGASKSKKEIDIPAGIRLVDDATAIALNLMRFAPNQTREVYILDPITISLVKNTIAYRGKSTVTIKGKEFTADLIEVTDPRAVTKLFVSGKGDLIKMTGPIGIEMFPETKAMALSPSTTANADLGFLSSIKPSRVIENVRSLDSLKLTITGIDFSRAPSDELQRVETAGNTANVTLTAPPALKRDLPLAELAAKIGPAERALTLADTNIPANKDSFVKLSKEILGDANTVDQAAERVRDYVHKLIRPNTSIAILRDASEILKTKEGLCRDYTILSATILRAAGIPARLVSGLVYDDQAFFYHAWNEYWDGTSWVPLDATLNPPFTVGHLKLAQGTFAEAFLFFVLDGAKISVIETRYRS